MYVDVGGEGPVGQKVLVYEDADADAQEEEERCDDDSEYSVVEEWKWTDTIQKRM
jgi:hypothetical protein